MPHQSDRASTPRYRRKAQDPSFTMLVVGRDHTSYDLLCDTVDDKDVTFVQAQSLAEARSYLAVNPVDLALVETQMPDGNGIDFMQEIGALSPLTQSISLADESDFNDAVAAVRNGASDIMVKPLASDELSKCVSKARKRSELSRDQDERLARLKRVCKKLNRIRHEMTDQVDILCQDLVTAYQDLASQMQQVVQTTEFSGQLKEELDLEQVVRKTLEYLLQKAGPTNAAIFLPSSMDEYSLGGYVNYDCTGDSADMLLEHMADLVAPTIAERSGPAHITDNDALQAWLGDEGAFLADSHIFAFPCRHDEETLAVIILFRDDSMPYDADFIETCTAIAPMLGGYLARVIRIHHRHVADFEEDDGLAFGF